MQTFAIIPPFSFRQVQDKKNNVFDTETAQYFDSLPAEKGTVIPACGRAAK
jgi:hypothetical protein